jgi:ribosomal protein L37AE/L43A
MNETIWDCELCDSTDVPVSNDPDLGLWLCESCFAGFNGHIIDVDFSE